MQKTKLTQRFNPDLLQLAKPLQVVFFDVDGVFTDGGVYYSDTSESLKRFHTIDGYGIKLLRSIGVEIVVISGRDSAALRKRLAELKINNLELGVENKLSVAEKFLSKLNLTWAQAAAIGDDWPDLPILKRAKLAVAPPQAHIEVLKIAHYTTNASGGVGAVRELCDLILQAKEQYANLLNAQLS